MKRKHVKLALFAAALLASRLARAQDLPALQETVRSAFRDRAAASARPRNDDPLETVEVVSPRGSGYNPAPALSKLTGVGDAGIQMKRIVESLRDPARAASLGIRIPRSILLVGPAAAAKARVLDAFLKDAGLTYHQYKGGDLISHSVGSGGGAVEKAFAIARRDAPSLLVIDPIESIAGKRETIYDVPESRQFLEEMAKPDPTPADRLPSFILVGVAQDDQAVDPTIASSFDATIKVASGDPQN